MLSLAGLLLQVILVLCKFTIRSIYALLGWRLRLPDTTLATSREQEEADDGVEYEYKESSWEPCWSPLKKKASLDAELEAYMRGLLNDERDKDK